MAKTNGAPNGQAICSTEPTDIDGWSYLTFSAGGEYSYNDLMPTVTHLR